MSRRVHSGRPIAALFAAWLLAFSVLSLAPPTQRRALAGKWPRPALGPSVSGDPEVLFTFDDGPDEIHTKTILDILAARHIQAIFFWVGRRIKPGKNVEKRRAMVTRAVREGHLIGNHTVNHAQLCAVGKKAAAKEIDDNEAMFTELTGMPIRIFRVPYGSKCKPLETQLAERGLHHLHWDIDPQEWLHHDSNQAAASVIAKLKVLEGRAVILLHDTKRVSVRALPKILDWIDAENLRRAAKGKKQIRILRAATVLAEELLSPGLSTWLVGAADASRTAVTARLGLLLPN